MLRVTITFTRQTAETPWYWQIAPSDELSPVEDFVEANNGGVDTHTYVHENKCIVSYAFNDDQLIEEFRSLIESQTNSEYVRYCEDNNISIDVSVEDV